MAHNPNQMNGKYSMFCTGDTNAAWRKLGQRTPNAVTWEQAMDLAQLNWTVIKQQLFGDSLGGFSQSVAAFGIFRQDNGAFLGSVGDRYTPMQNENLFTIGDLLVESTGGSHYDSAGALGQGERVWCCIKLPFDFEIDGGDKHQTFLMGLSSHDGSLSTIWKLVDFRVVCGNTFQSALSSGDMQIKVKHTANAHARLESAARTMQGIGNTAAKLRTKLERMAETKLHSETVHEIMNRLFPVKTTANGETVNQTRRENMIADILRVYEINDKNAYPSVKGTAYNLLNAVTDYTDHIRNPRGAGQDSQAIQQARAESAMFGSGDKLKESALDIIYDVSMAAGGNILDAAMSRTVL
jgi:phage/plasmid-like protein (TIGR03299 family)